MLKLPRSRRSVAWVTGILCIACCTLPFAGLVFGSAALAAVAVYFEVAAISVVVLGVALLVYKLATRRKAPVCNLDCNSRPKV